MGDEADFVRGLQLLLTCRLEECEAHFGIGLADEVNLQRRVRSMFGHSLVAVVRALTTFYDDDLAEARARLSNAQKLALSSKSSSGSTMSWLFSSKPSSTEDAKREHDIAIGNLEMELLSADAGLFLSLIQFTQESAVGIMNATLTLRKSIKLYQKATKELRELGSKSGRSRRSSSNEFSINLEAERRKRVAKRVPCAQLVVFDEEVYFDAVAEPELALDQESKLGDDGTDGYGPLISRVTSVEERVRASAKLGTGLFHLVFSFVPRRFSGFVGSAMGFDATPDRKKGLHCLRICIDQGTSRSPLAALCLLAFHSAMLIFARGISDEGDEKEAMEVLETCLRQYPDSAIFRFFEGRLLRGQAKIKRAAEVFEVSQHCSRNITQLAQLSMYERAWCTGLMQGRSREAAHLFGKVARNSKWTFFAYAAACFYLEDAFRVLCLDTDEEMKALSQALSLAHPNDAAVRSLRDALTWFKLIPTMVKRTVTVPPEKFAVARSNEMIAAWQEHAQGQDVAALTKETLGKIMCGLFWPSMELIYMWNALFQLDNRGYRRIELEKAICVFRKVLPESDRRLGGYEAFFHLYMGALLREERLFHSAEQHLALVCASPQTTTKSSDLVDDRWPIEFAKYEWGLCAWEQGEKKRAVQWWSAVKDSGHHLDQRLQFRVKWALRRAEQQQIIA